MAKIRSFILLAIVFFLLLSAPFIKAQDEDVRVETESDDEKPATSTDSYVAPQPSGKTAFFENFNEDFHGRWVQSQNSKYNGRFEWGTPSTLVGIAGDKGLLVPAPARRYGIAAPIVPPVDTTDKDLVVQYEVKLQEKLECGGAYIKLLTDDTNLNLENFDDTTPYIIMFGPDKCGSNNKVHFIFRHFNPKSGEWQEKHLKNPPTIKNDQKTHLYTLVVRQDNSFEIFIDQESVRTGNLLEDFDPPVIPPALIDDPTDVKPADWVDEAKIPDPTATKPEDWDEEAPLEIPDETDVKPADWLDNEPLMIPDPNAQKPEDWNDEEDGAWEPLMIPNPKCEEVGCGEWKPRMIRNPAYKGKWRAPLIDNPAYKGEWKPRQIPNPNYFEDKHPHNFPKMGALAVEIWTMQGSILFDNFLIAHDYNVARDYAEKTWVVKHELETKAEPKREETKKEGSDFMTQATLIFNEVVIRFRDLMEQYPVPTLVGTAVVALLLPLSLWGMLRRGNKAAATSAAPKAKKESMIPTETKDKKEESGSEEEEKEEEATTATSADKKKNKTIKKRKD